MYISPKRQADEEAEDGGDLVSPRDYGDEEVDDDGGMEIREVSLGFLSILSSLPSSGVDFGQQPNKLEDKLKHRNDKRSTLTNSGAESLAQEIEQRKLTDSPRNDRSWAPSRVIPSAASIFDPPRENEDGMYLPPPQPQIYYVFPVIG